MNLRELRAAYPDLFYQQDWFDDEPFMERHIQEPPDPPLAVMKAALPGGLPAPPAISYAWSYVLSPNLPVWGHWLWTCDNDREGQRVYVGRRNGLFEIHRFLNTSDRFGIGLW